LSFVRGDCQNLPFKNQAFDLLTSFEVIEHIDNQNSFLKEASRVLNQNGMLILSTPIRQDFDLSVTPHHKHEFTPKELEDLLGFHFAQVQVEAKKIVDKDWKQRHGSFIGRNLRKLRRSYFGNIIAGLYDLYLNPVQLELESICASNDFTNAWTMLARAEPRAKS
jgi:ubiquinone/menaquinone biosynthesis C-methylase UbiE